MDELTPEQIKNLNANLAQAAKMTHVYLEVEEMKTLDPKDRQAIILALGKTLTDEEARDSILQLQKMLCNR